ncbi:MAG: hypothetical protein Q8N51_03540, partial [Gammaproteobacteria bacterium]|nr:hypothetical protein [Gammaproteobacteria bacterium]
MADHFDHPEVKAALEKLKEERTAASRRAVSAEVTLFFKGLIAQQRSRRAARQPRKSATPQLVADFAAALPAGTKYEVLLVEAAVHFSVSERTIARHIAKAKEMNL